MNTLPLNYLPLCSGCSVMLVKPEGNTVLNVLNGAENPLSHLLCSFHLSVSDVPGQSCFLLLVASIFSKSRVFLFNKARWCLPVSSGPTRNVG